jgi:NACHT domain
VFRASDWGDWINTRIRALWIHGIPGAGKTVLAAHIIETTLRICEAKDKRTTCVYYYCYHGHNQDESVPFLRWLVSQLLREADTVPILAWEAYTWSREPDTTLLLDVLHATLDFFDLVYVAIDALDESQSRQNLLSVLNVLVTDPRFWKIQLLATSREYSDIKLKMGRFSQSLSMSNCFVEADIRIYVAAKIMAEAKFQRWPSDLRTDVEAALSTGAKGMFRWAVCQLDILRRLNRQSKIREAIKSLPKTMDETYERIFSYIVDEEKEFVRHTLHWVCFHDLLWKGSVPLPADLLIDAYIALDKGKSRLSSDEYLYDLETLKDSCGCLVSFTFNEEDQSQLANIAHYTVREFLESDRSSFTSWFSIKRKTSYDLILAFVLEYAITEPIETPEDWGVSSPLDLGSTSSLQEYCLATSVRSLRDLEELIEPRLAFRFLNPLEAHFEALQTALSILGLHGSTEILSPAYRIAGFWDVRWHESTKNSKTAILANLLLMNCFSLAKDFIQDLDIESVLQETLFGSISPSISWLQYPGSGEFECNLVEFLAEIREFDKDMLDFFQREARGLVCYTDLLPRYMPGHTFDEAVCDGSRVLPRLLQLGANPDPKGFQVTPLQIAVFSRDLAGVRMLLEAGADSNNTGDEQGIKWHAEISILRPFCRLHGLAPLCILRHLKAYPYIEDDMTIEEIDDMNGAVTTDIERLLLDYGASTVSVGE